MKMDIVKTVIMLLAISSFTGCATITSEEYQAVTLTAKTKDGQRVADAKCSMKNDKGAWDSNAPGNPKVHRSAEDLIVECKKDGHQDGFLRAISRAANGMWGNIIFGGGVGAIIDHNKGTGYDYPVELPVVMGETTIVDRKNELEKLNQETDSAEADIQANKKTSGNL